MNHQTRSEWYAVPQRQEELAGILQNTVLREAIAILNRGNRPTLSSSLELTTLALIQASQAGYQKALDDLESMARPNRPSENHLLSRDWAKPTTTATV